MGARICGIAGVLAVAVIAAALAHAAGFVWSDDELSTLRGLSIATGRAPLFCRGMLQTGGVAFIFAA